MISDLGRLVDYEEWANGEWLAALPRFRDVARAESVMRHVAGCYSGWLPLVSDWVDVRGEDWDFRAALPGLYAALREVAAGDLEREVSWERLGERRGLTAGELLHHMLNHGTYHRGHLRGLAEVEGLADFPDTDSVKFFVRPLG